MKKALIVCDNYKISLFRDELAKIGFNDITSSPFTKGTSKLEFFYLPNELQDLKITVARVESYFQYSCQN